MYTKLGVQATSSIMLNSWNQHWMKLLQHVKFRTVLLILLLRLAGAMLYIGACKYCHVYSVMWCGVMGHVYECWQWVEGRTNAWMDAQTDANVTKPGATMYVDPSIHFNTARIVTYWTCSTFFNRRGTSCVQVVFFLTFTDKLTESASAPWHFDTLAFMAFDKWWMILQGHKAIFKTFQNTCSQAHHVPIEGTCALYLHLPSVLELEPWGLCQRTSAFSILFSIFFILFSWHFTSVLMSMWQYLFGSFWISVYNVHDF